MKNLTDSTIELIDNLSFENKKIYDKAFQYSLRALSRRDHCQKEMKKKLIEKQYEQEIYELVLQRLCDLGYISDEKLAQTFIQSGTNKGLSSRNLQQKLYHRGVDPEILKEAIEQIDEDVEFENALSYAKKIATREDLNDPKTKQKIYRKLAYRGYQSSAISKALKIMLDGDDEFEY